LTFGDLKPALQGAPHVETAPLFVVGAPLLYVVTPFAE